MSIVSVGLVTTATEQLDGRRLRREHNRAAVVDALVSLFEDGVYQPNSAQIAERAGLSPRSLFRYFDDVDDLNRAAIAQQLATARPLLDVGAGADDPLPVRIGRLVDARIRLYDAITPGARAARITAHRHPLVAKQVADSRSYLREQIRRLFACELSGDRHDLLPAVDALCSFETYELMRRDQKMSRPKVANALNRALTTLLDPTGEPA
jgi:AcrR family transcriptional regulator